MICIMQGKFGCYEDFRSRQERGYFLFFLKHRDRPESSFLWK
jgi:hypothetical protein